MKDYSRRVDRFCSSYFICGDGRQTNLIAISVHGCCWLDLIERIAPRVADCIGKTLIVASFGIAKRCVYLASRLEQAMQKELNQMKIDEEVARQKLDMELDRELEATFPASDPLKITRTDTQTRFSRQNRRM
jgi:hypothetical protein